MNSEKKNIFFITSTLPRIHGGRTKSLLQRARLLNEKGVNITIISTNYNPEYDEVYSFFRAQKRVLDNTHFDNIYDYYKEKYNTGKNKSNWKEVLFKYVGDLSKYVRVKRSSKNDRTYFYENGIPRFVIKGLDSGKVEFFALFRDWNFEPFKFFNINKRGFVHRIDTYDVKGFRCLQEFVMDDGNIYLTKNINKKRNIIKISLGFSENIIEFSDEKKLFTHFFNDFFSENDVIINDARLLDKSLLDSRVGKRIFQLHNSHLINPLDTTSGVKNSFKTILSSNFPENDIIVTLTDKQKLDIVTKIPNLKNNITVIPHSTKSITIQYKKEKNHFGVICRLHPQKNLKDAIKAFYLFDQEISGYYLDVFGEGESREDLQSLVMHLRLEDKVIFHGNVQNVNQAYQKIFALLITSNFEGFGLNALESIANGTPVITYEVNYGPTDIIDENSGWVADSRSPESLKEKMVIAINNPKDTKEVQKRAEYFSEDNFVSKWLGVIGHD